MEQRGHPFQYSMTLVILAKVEQLNRLEQVENLLALLNCLREQLQQPGLAARLTFTEITRLDMLQCCRSKTEPSEKLQKAIRQTLADNQVQFFEKVLYDHISDKLDRFFDKLRFQFLSGLIRSNYGNLLGEKVKT